MFPPLEWACFHVTSSGAGPTRECPPLCEWLLCWHSSYCSSTVPAPRNEPLPPLGSRTDWTEEALLQSERSPGEQPTTQKPTHMRISETEAHTSFIASSLLVSSLPSQTGIAAQQVNTWASYMSAGSSLRCSASHPADGTSLSLFLPPYNSAFQMDKQINHVYKMYHMLVLWITWLSALPSSQEKQRNK